MEAWWKWSNWPRPVRVVIIILIILIFLWASANIYRIFQKPPNAHYISGGGNIPLDWDKRKVTDDLFDAFSGINIAGGRDVPMKVFNDLNDNQMVAVYNDWNNRKATEGIFMGMGSYGTLTETLDAERFIPGTEDLRQAQIMYANLNRLKLK